MKTLITILIIFLAITGANTLMIDYLHIPFGQISFWDRRGLFFLFFIAFFPRLTLLFSSVAFGGLFWWLGLVFAPRILVAVLATPAYWHTNPALVIIAWLVAMGGESSEKMFIKKPRFHFSFIRPSSPGQAPRQRGKKLDDGAIEAEYKEL
jgi:hypothetical protein